jgi:peptidoglycan/LPS O-acetylase OafA/YrhL
MVVIFHAWGYYRVYGPKTLTDGADNHLLMHQVLSKWQSGVEVFFVISGFILGVPFARHALKNERRVVLKQYFLRRLTRLEPPYILAMLLLFAGSIAIGKYTFQELFPSLLASLVYLHNIVFLKAPLVTVVAWSLEIEIQFYILAPLIALAYRLPALGRRALLLGGVVGFPLLQILYVPPFLSIYSYLQFFLAGFVLADLYAVGGRDRPTSWWTFALGFALLGAVLFLDARATALNRVVHPLLILGLGYAALFFADWRKAFGHPWISTIGGMCYSIYLLHFATISMFGRFAVRVKPSSSFIVNFLAYLSIQIAVILALSAVFFYFIEKPCMRRDWYKGLPMFRRGSVSEHA